MGSLHAHGMLLHIVISDKKVMSYKKKFCILLTSCLILLGVTSRLVIVSFWLSGCFLFRVMDVLADVLIDK